MEEFSIPLGSEASHLAMRPLLGALENESISMTILGKASPKQKSHLPEKEGGIRFFNGAKRIRTADPLHAMQVLYQLSYGPVGCVRLRECWWGNPRETCLSGWP